jgi:rubrerythrin
MQLNNFGSILSFAADMEAQDEAFFASAIKNSGCAAYKGVFEQILSDCQKNQKTLQRVRRENVTEMILEGISDFSSDSYEVEHGTPADKKPDDVLALAVSLENRAEQYYLDAAEKIKALSEVARALKMLAKKRTAHKTALAAL